MADVNADIATTLRSIQGRLGDVAKARAFYSGTQADVYDQKVWEEHFGKNTPQPRDNMCPLAVDTVVSRLTPKAFASRNEEAGDADGTTAAEAVHANRLAKSVRFEQVAPEIHREGGKVSRAAVLVGVNSKGKAVFYPQAGDTFHFEYDEEQPDQTRFVGRVWTVGGSIRVNLHYPDVTLRFITNSDNWNSLPKTGAAFRPYNDDGKDAAIENPMGRVGMFEFSLEKSDLQPLYRLQPALDLALCDLLVLSHIAGHPQRYITGATLDDDTMPPLGTSTTTTALAEEFFGTQTGIGDRAQPGEVTLESGPAKTWFVEDPNARVGQLSAAELEGTLRLIDNIRMAMLRDTSIPPHMALMHTGHFPSGKALRTAESQFVAKVLERRMSWGNVWEDVFSFAVQAEMSHNEQGEFTSLAEAPLFELVWDSPFTEEGLSPEDALLGLINMGVPMSIILSEMYGFGPDRAQEVEALAERIRSERALVQATVQTLNRDTLGGAPATLEASPTPEQRQALEA